MGFSAASCAVGWSCMNQSTTRASTVGSGGSRGTTDPVEMIQRMAAPGGRAARAQARLSRGSSRRTVPVVFRPDLAGSLSNLAIRLIDLGQREPALRAAQQAVDIRRELAAQRPDVYQPDLARSLIVLALRTRDARSAADALPFAHDAVATLSPEFLRHQSSHSGLMRAMRREYLELCESAGQAPDPELLAPLLPYFGDTN